MKHLLLLLLTCALSAAPMQDRSCDVLSLQDLARSLGIEDTEDLVAATQKRWLRKAGQERWEMTELPAEQREKVLKWAHEAGLYAPWSPAVSHYDTALIFGASSHVLSKRLGYLKELWEQGTRFDEVIWLTGLHPLDVQIDPLAHLCPSEYAAAQLLWDEADLPAELRQLPVHFIGTPMQGERRPNTADTIVDWLNTSPAPGTALFISSQPFCGYQHAILKALMPSEIDFDVAGPGVDPATYPLSAAITLDTLARWLYAEYAPF